MRRRSRSLAAALVVGALLSAAPALGAVAQEVPDAAPPAAPAEESRTLLVTPRNAVVAVGSPITFQVVVLDAEGGVPLEPQPELEIFLGSDMAVDTVEGFTVTPGSAGPRSIIVRAGNQYDATELTAVDPTVELQLSASAPSVAQGGYLDFTVVGTDQFGNSVDTGAAVLTSSVASDVVDGRRVTFPTASPHTITATLDGASVSLTVEVVPQAVDVAKAELAETGVEIGATGAAALAIVLLGGALVLRRRRVLSRR